MKIAKREGMARKAAKEAEVKVTKHAQRGAYKGFLVATVAELEAWANRAGDDNGLRFWAQAAVPELQRQIGKLADVRTETVRAAGKLDAAEKELAIQARAAAADAERARKGKRQWDAVDREIEERLEALETERDALRIEVARLRAELDSAAPWVAEVSADAFADGDLPEWVTEGAIA